MHRVEVPKPLEPPPGEQRRLKYKEQQQLQQLLQQQQQRRQLPPASIRGSVASSRSRPDSKAAPPPRPQSLPPPPTPAASPPPTVPPRLLHGRPHIEDTLCGLPFEVSDESFFQTNTEQAEVGVDQVWIPLVWTWCGSGVDPSGVDAVYLANSGRPPHCTHNVLSVYVLSIYNVVPHVVSMWSS